MGHEALQAALGTCVGSSALSFEGCHLQELEAAIAAPEQGRKPLVQKVQWSLRLCIPKELLSLRGATCQSLPRVRLAWWAGLAAASNQPTGEADPVGLWTTLG